MNSFGLFNRIVKGTFQMIGADIVRRKNSPALTLLGLKKKPIHTIIDVGANTGQFARSISKFYPKATIYCFEPLPEPYRALEQWSKNQTGKVKVFNLAIGAVEGQVEMFLHEAHTSSSSLLATTNLIGEYYPFIKNQKRIFVRQTTLDAALEESQILFIPEILIKLDVQGYEDRVISGGSNIFSKASTCILEVNLDSLYEGQADFKDLLLMLDNLGYQYAGNLAQSYGDDGHCVYLDAVFLRRQPQNSVHV